MAGKGAVPCSRNALRFCATHQSERDSNISASLSLSWFRAKTQRIPDTWDGTLRVASHECVLTQRWTQSHKSERDISICASLSLTWFYVWCCVKTQSWDATLKDTITNAWVPSHVSGMRCVFAQNHESERDSNISASLSLSWFCAKTQRIPNTWDGTL